MRLSMIPAALLFATASLAGCSSPAEEADASEAAFTAPEVFLEAKLRSEAHAKPDPTCDLYTLARLAKTSSGSLVLQLEEKLDGNCEMPMPAPDKRSYTVKQTDDCGSKVYSGRASGSTAVFTDNRARTCEGVLEDLLVIEETRKGGQLVVLFGAPNAPAPRTPKLPPKP